MSKAAPFLSQGGTNEEAGVPSLLNSPFYLLPIPFLDTRSPASARPLASTQLSPARSAPKWGDPGEGEPRGKRGPPAAPCVRGERRIGAWKMRFTTRSLRITSFFPLGAVRCACAAAHEVSFWYHQANISLQVTDSTMSWRRVRDSNPRYPFGYAGFQDRCHQPLGQLSA